MVIQILKNLLIHVQQQILCMNSVYFYEVMVEMQKQLQIKIKKKHLFLFIWMKIKWRHQNIWWDI